MSKPVSKKILEAFILQKIKKFVVLPVGM